MQEAADVNQDFGANKNVKTLNLRLEEVAHIRSVLTKAELEAMAIDSAMRDSIARGKVWRLLLGILRHEIWNAFLIHFRYASIVWKRSLAFSQEAKNAKCVNNYFAIDVILE